MDKTLRLEPDAVAILQQEVLAKLRAGRELRATVQGGGTSIRIESGVLILREEALRPPRVQLYCSEGQMLKFLREYFDFEARINLLVADPDEVEVWEFIREQF